MPRMVPERLLDASTANFGIGHLLSYQDLGYREEYDPDAVWIFDTIIPPFQRELVWDESADIRFIESIWMGMDIGRYVVNDAMDAPSSQMKGKSVRWHPTDRWLIDGQQRLTCIHRYINDRFAIKGSDGLLHMWSDLTKIDQRQFGNRPFDRAIVKIYNELDLRVLYDRMNYGGVAHRPDQRALPDGEAPDWSPKSIF